MSFHLIKGSINSNPFAGLFARANEDLLIVPPRVPEKKTKEFAEALGVEPLHLMINDSPYLGLFIALNSKGCVLPRLSEESEAKALKKAGLNVCVLDSPLSPGNTIMCNDKAVLLSPRMPKPEANRISDALGVEAFQQEFGGIPAFASTSVVTNAGLYAYNELTDVELKHLEKLFGVHALIGTTNFGVPFNALALIANTKGAIAGSMTTGVETQRIYEALSGD